jgi:YVTN family beta-propeller protein
MNKRILILLGLLLFFCPGIYLNAQTGDSQYKVANIFHLPGDSWWDCLSVDASTGRLFISHGTEVLIVDENTGNVIATIDNQKGAHDIALATDLNKGFISNGMDSSVTVFDLGTYGVLSKINTTGRNPDIILYDLFSHCVFTFNGGSSNSTVIDAATNDVKATIPLDGRPEFAVADGNGKVYLNIEDKSELSVINTSTFLVEQTWPIAPGEEASGLAMDIDNHRLFIVCHNKLMVVMDALNGKVITSLPIGEHVDGAGFDPVLMRAYSSNGDGTLTVVQESGSDNFSVLENVATKKGARTCAVDTKTHHIFLPTAEFGPPPAPTAENPHPRPTLKPGTFVLIDVAPVK